MKTLARLVLGFFLLVALICVARLMTGCAGAPHNAKDLAAMPQAQFDSWSGLKASEAEEAAFAQVSSRPASAQDVRNLALALRTISGAATQGSVAQLVKSEAYAGLIRIAVLELGALVDGSLGDSAAYVRVESVMASVATALEAGVARAEEPKAMK